MKKKIRGTGEIVDVTAYCAPLNEIRADGDWVSYIDSGGFEHYCCTGLNIYWDFEDVEEELAKEIDWEERRYEITKTIVHAQVSGPIIPGVDPNPSIAASAKLAVAFADALIAELKKGQENKTGQEKPVQKNHRKTNV